MERYGWTEKGVGFSLAYVGLCIAIVQGGLTRIIIPKIGEQRAVYTGLILNTIGMIAVALSGEGWMLFIAMIPLSMGGLAGPSLQSITSKEIPANEQGELQGFMTSVMSITAIIGPLLMTNLFSAGASGSFGFDLPGAPYLCSALLLVSGLLFSWFTFRWVKARQASA
jgi:DHA1 family tetracycline resistance protein-like MFS transporter